MKKLFLLFPVLLAACAPKNVMISNSAIAHRSLCEPSISINKANPNNIVAGAILDRVYYSGDGGKTWMGDTLKSSYGVWGDPVLVSDYTGVQYFFHLSDPTGKNWMSEEILDRIVCQKSTDGGHSWNDGSFMGFNHPKDQDKQWVGVDKENNLYVTWTQFDKYGSKKPKDKSNILFSKSTDAGLTWSEAKQINEIPGDCLDGDNTTEGAVPAIDKEGNIYVAWSNKNKIYFDKSTDGGESWMPTDLVIDEHHGGWEIEIPGLQRANGMPVTVCDDSDGPHSGALYVSWVDDRNGDYDVWMSKSVDQGKSWSVAQRINNDKSGRDQFFHWMTCDPVTGYLYTIFYDRRKTEGNATEVYMAVSKDGGESWKNKKVSKEAFTPVSNVFFGDYNDIDAYNGVVRPIWTRLDENGMSIWTALVK